MKIEVVDTYEGFLRLEDVWNRLLEQSQSEHVCLTFEWVKCWWKAFGQGNELCILLVSDADDSLIAIAPLMLTREKHAGFPVKKIKFIYNDNASRADFIITGKTDEVLGAVLGYAQSNAKKWDVIELQNISEDSPNYTALREACLRRGITLACKEGLNSPYIPIEGDWNTYLSKRSHKLRKNLKNKMNRLERVGHYSIEKIDLLENSRDIFEQMCAISQKSWKVKCKGDISFSEANKQFFSGLNNVFGSRGLLAVWLMHIDKRAVAYEYALRYKDKAYALRADYDQEYKQLSPGTVLHVDMLRNYFAGGLRECDLCGNDEEYKKRWTSHSRQHHTFILYRDSIYSKLLYVVEGKVMYPLRQFLKRFKLARRFKKIITDQRRA